MDMYQKRKARKKQNINKQEENNNKMNINWLMLFYGNTIESVDISRFL